MFAVAPQHFGHAAAYLWSLGKATACEEFQMPIGGERTVAEQSVLWCLVMVTVVFRGWFGIVKR